MDVRNTSSGLDNLLLQLIQGTKTTGTRSTTGAQPPAINSGRISGQEDIIDLSDRRRVAEQQNERQNNQPAFQQNQSRLVSETIERLENGFRRTQEFEAADGRTFTRVEEVTNSANRSRRNVIQQNSSGSSIALENILDRQADGTFRLSERFTDEVGETSTNIEFNVTPDDADILLGRSPAAEQQNDNPFRPTRGTQIDVSA